MIFGPLEFDQVHGQKNDKYEFMRLTWLENFINLLNLINMNNIFISNFIFGWKFLGLI